MNWYKKSKWEDQLPGGLADHKKPEDFDQEQLEIGKNIEFEHTNDPDIATEIAMDHLEEFDNYYVELEKMEDKLEEEEND